MLLWMYGKQEQCQTWEKIDEEGMNLVELVVVHHSDGALRVLRRGKLQENVTFQKEKNQNLKI